MDQRYTWVVTLYVNPGEEEAFAAYEGSAAALMSAHGGRIERVVRCADAGRGPEAPYEVHLVQFPSRQAFDRFREAARTGLDQALRARAICRTELHAGWEVPPPGAGP